jgi:hypothetical protein
MAPPQRKINREIKHYFTQKSLLVEPTFIKDNQVWLRNANDFSGGDIPANIGKDNLWFL